MNEAVPGVHRSRAWFVVLLVVTVGASFALRTGRWTGTRVLGSEKTPLRTDKAPAPVTLASFYIGFKAVIGPAWP